MGGGGKGGGSTSTTTGTVRYAPYIEEHHEAFLDIMATERAAVIDTSPYTSYTDIEIEDAFFGSGYTIASFPSLYDMYGKFMAGLDIEVLWTQAYDDTVNGTAVENLISAESDLMDADIEANVLPRFQTGMRDMNAVMGSSYVIGKAIIEDARVKSLSKYSAELKYKLIPVAQDRWEKHLKWNQGVIATYSEIMKLYFAAKIDVDNQNYGMDMKDKLWPFTVLDYERAAIGALQGATSSSSTTKTDQEGGFLGAASGILGLVGLGALFL